ncbi:MAG: MMPL family transporter [Planctomycetes bacterium]|nr:MMPL family transporter [Planctomycetota bacterium]
MAPSIFAGVLTTVAAFVVLGFSEFRGLRELGIVSGIGLSLMLVQLLVALPAFLARFGPRRIHHATHLAWLGRSVLHRRWLYGGLTVVALLGAVVVLARAGALTRFDSDARNLRPAHDPLLDQQRALLKDLGLGSDRLQIMLDGADTERVIEAAATLAEHAAAQPGTTACTLVEPLPRSLPDGVAVVMPEDTQSIAGGRVFDTPIGRLRAERISSGRLEGLSWVGAQRPAPGSPPLAVGTPITMRPLFAGLPPAVLSLVSPARQRAALARLASEVDWDGLNRLESGLPAALRERHRGFFADLGELRERSAASRPLMLDDFAGTPLASLVRAFYRRADGRSQLLARFQADDLGAGGLRVADYAAALSIDAVAADSGVAVTPVGVSVLGEALQDALLADFARLGLWTALAVFALLMLLMRGFDAVVAMLALGAGALLMLAGMQLADLSWNLVNIGVLPLIIGIGIDASIYFINALRRHRRDRHGVGAALSEVAHPMLMTTGAAIIGFASLLGSDYRGLRSMGLVAILGMATCLLVAVVALPVAALFTSHRRHRPEDPLPHL